MIDIGQKMRFIPYWNISKQDTSETKRENQVTGKVIYVNRQHKSFTIKYTCCGGCYMKETFKFSEIGQNIFLVGGKRNG